MRRLFLIFLVLDVIRSLVADKEPTPNKFTIAMGELMRKARVEEGLSQGDLAKKINRRRATISDIENGKTEVGSSALVLLAAALNKPITYFFPSFVYNKLRQEEFSPLEIELIDRFQYISDDHLKKVALDIVRVLADFDTSSMILESYNSVLAREQAKSKLREITDTKKIDNVRKSQS